MWRTRTPEDPVESLLLAGQRVSRGVYRNVETGLCLQFEQDSILPPSFDGRVACYVVVPNAWHERTEIAPGEREHQSKVAG